MPWRNDLSYLFPLKSQTSEQDRGWLANLMAYTRELRPSYKYLEVGSYLGGTLTAALIDERCAEVLSIDLRPNVQADARGAQFDYSRVSTHSMRQELQKVPHADLSKLTTFDGTANIYTFGEKKFELAFIDAEHTDEAVFADFLSVVDHLADNSICAFHDSNLTTAGLENICAFLRYTRRPHRFMTFQRSLVSAVFLGANANNLPPAILRGEWDWAEFKERSRDHLLLDQVRNRVSVSFDVKPAPVLPADQTRH